MSRWFGRRKTRNEKAFKAASQRALGSPDPEERVSAAKLALSLFETLDPWPFSQPTRRVAHGILLGSLAQSYNDLKFRDPLHHSEVAVEIHEEAMSYLREGDGEIWANLMINAAISYVERLSGDRSMNLEKAINCVEAAIERLDRKRNTETWIRAKINLAGYLCERHQGDRAENFERALAEQQDALTAISRRWNPLPLAVATRRRENRAGPSGSSVGALGASW